MPIVSTLARHYENDVEAYVKKHGVKDIDKFLKSKLHCWKEVRIKIAIIGGAGVGKSSYINAIRGLNDDDDGAATVDVVRCTTEPKCFPHPSNDKIEFWDLPGIGTPEYPTLKDYCKNVNLKSYDTFLILAANRFMEHDLELAKEITSLKKKFFFVRTKIDQNVPAEVSQTREEELLDRIRKNCLQNLEGSVPEDGADIFLISNHYPEKWEFARLTQAILDVLPIRQQEALTLVKHSSDFNI